jgi:FAD/FMN-containing dehydrogenase
MSSITQGSHRSTSRRALLTGAGSLLFLPWIARAATTPAARATRAVSEQAWRALAAKVKGGVVRPGDHDFIALSRPQNLRYATEVPLGVARPRDAVETNAAIAWCREQGIPMVLRSGGHSYAGCSATTGLIIHTGLMRQVRRVNDDTFELEAGALFSDVYHALEAARDTNAGGMALPHGRCFGVGTSAFLLGGGMGFAMREFGLGCDRMLEAEVALPDGRVVRASAEENADLFWALRGGGGGNLGVALRFKVGAEPAKPVTTYRIVWNRNVPAVFASLVRALEGAPDRMGSRIGIHATRTDESNPNTLTLVGQLRGPKDEARAILAPALATAPPDTDTMQTTPYWQGQKFLGVASPPNIYQATSRYSARLSDGAIEDVVRRCRTWPGTKASASFFMFHVGGRIRDIAPADTGYVHREAEWLTGTDVGWTEHDTPAVVATNLAWQREFHDASAALMPDGGSFQNFPDPGLADPAAAYYGANLERLVAIKRRIDPDGVFTPPRRQGIVA